MKDLIIGTDWGDDVDDAVAMRIYARASKKGLINILGIGINALCDDSVASLDGFLRTEGIDSVPIGADGEVAVRRETYQKRLSGLAGKYRSNSDAEDGAGLYRRLIAKAKGKVEIAEIGFLQIVEKLLKSEPDDISPLSGRELVREKVERMWFMAGRWESGREFNFADNAPARRAAAYITANCPVPIVYLGWEVGAEVISGSRLPEDDVLHLALSDYGHGEGRSSWDPMLAMLAIGHSDIGGDYELVRGKASVDAQTGVNSFARDENGIQGYVVKKHEDLYYSDKIDGLIK